MKLVCPNAHSRFCLAVWIGGWIRMTEGDWIDEAHHMAVCNF